MGSRGKILPLVEGRSIQAPGIIRHIPLSGLSSASSHRSREPLPPHLLEDEIAIQAADKKHLAEENHKLATAHLALRKELVAAQQEVQNLKGHIRSIQTESDIQIRLLLEKITKMEADIIASESVKKDLQQAHIEAQNLAASSQELTSLIQRATRELQIAQSDVKNLPDLQAELENVMQEHERLRATFEYQKSRNTEEAIRLKAREKNLIGMVREVERLRAEVIVAKKQAQANPYGGVPHIQAGATFADGYARPFQMGAGPVEEGMMPYGSSNGVVGVSTVPDAGDGVAWSAAHDASAARGSS